MERRGHRRSIHHQLGTSRPIRDDGSHVDNQLTMDYSGLNKACVKDMYPLPEEGEELASLMGYPYNCFLQLPKENSQIRIAEKDKEKTGFHTEEGVYCFTHMPKELKNSAATLQRMMEKNGDSKRTWLDERSRRSFLKDQKEIRQVTNVGHHKRRRRSNAMSTAKKRDNKLRAIGKEGKNPDTCFLCKIKNYYQYRVILPMSTQTILDAPPSAYAFDDPILFLAGLQSSWEHGQHRPVIFMGGKEMSFKNFIYIEKDEDLTFLPKDFSPGFNTGSTSVFINTEPVKTDEESAVEPATEPVNEHMGTTTDSGGVPKEILLLFMLGVLQPALGRGSAKQGEASALKDDTPVLSISDDDEGLEDCLELKDATASHIKISAITPPTWKDFLDNHLNVDLLDLHDRCYARQAIMDNAVNRRPRELLKAKCEAAMTNFDKNPAVLLLGEKMSSLAAEAKEHKGNLDRLMLESQKWSGYQVILSALESKVASFKAEKANLKAIEALVRQEIEEVKHDRKEVVSKVVPYACMEILYSDELGRLVRKLVSSAITFGRCRAYEQVTRMKEPFDLLKVKGYRPSYEKEHTQASNDLATATFSWLNE
ncbi:putative reverse transcriptase domain-containing protein [Tanacetum coccineum]